MPTDGRSTFGPSYLKLSFCRLLIMKRGSPTGVVRSTGRDFLSVYGCRSDWLFGIAARPTVSDGVSVLLIDKIVLVVDGIKKQVGIDVAAAVKVAY